MSRNFATDIHQAAGWLAQFRNKPASTKPVTAMPPFIINDAMLAPRVRLAGETDPRPRTQRFYAKIGGSGGTVATLRDISEKPTPRLSRS